MIPILPKIILLYCLLLIYAFYGPNSLAADELVYSSCQGNNWNLWLHDTNLKSTTQLTHSKDLELFDPNWFSRENTIAYADNSGRIAIIDTVSRETRILKLPQGRYNHPRIWPGQEDKITFSSLIAVPTDHSTIDLVGYNKGNVSSVSKLIDRKGMSTFAVVSPDTQKAAYSYWSEEKPRSDYFGIIEEIWLRDIANGTDQQLTDLQADSYGASWSPSGRFLAFSSNKRGNYDIWLHDFASDKTFSLIRTSVKESQPVWSADEKSIYYIAINGGKSQIFNFTINGGTTIQVTKDSCGIRSFDVKKNIPAKKSKRNYSDRVQK